MFVTWFCWQMASPMGKVSVCVCVWTVENKWVRTCVGLCEYVKRRMKEVLKQPWNIVYVDIRRFKVDVYIERII